MLQQTQVDRVVPKFEEFIERFPTIASLAQASVADVLRLWQGLGYNSRAVRLLDVAVAVRDRFGGVVPHDLDSLRTLPGIGPYTAAAIAAFAYDMRVAPIDTNIRRIVHRLFFGLEYPVKATHTQLDEKARSLVPAGKAHDWNSALMDLGSTICTARNPKCLLCPLQKNCVAAPIDPAALDSARRRHAKKRSPQNAIPFERTTRFARGRIIDRLRALRAGERISLLDLHGELTTVLRERTLEELDALVAILEREGLVARDGALIALRD
ncbi:MAG: A/G-specific adenine glycosylase [Candidatus Eremiobacteraeota bacterium]|nr:A/G-specific adenine glycosylase [Candidatus Eremiobacteraeota bacterium]